MKIEENINLMISAEEIEELMNAPVGLMKAINEGTITKQDKVRVELKKVDDHWEIDK